MRRSSLVFLIADASALLAFTVLMLNPRQTKQVAVVKQQAGGAATASCKSGEAGTGGPAGAGAQPAAAAGRYLGTLRAVAAGAEASGAGKTAASAKVQAAVVRAQRQELRDLGARTRAELEAEGRQLRAAGFPAQVGERHRELVDQLAARQGELDGMLARLETAHAAGRAGEAAAVAGEVRGFFELFPLERRQQPVDVKDLAFRPGRVEARRPARSEGELDVALAGRQQALQTTAAAAAPPPPQPADLAATVDVQITPRIRALAAELNNNPVAIYSWVRNNIVWLPTHGSVQGSDMTLVTRRGNAFDTASLLIALYRAAGIPARYVYGTAELPVASVLNWVGGARRLEAAQQLMGQGGIPNVAIVTNNVLTGIQLEHVWVEAFVDFVPSRGAINRTPDTWVSLDPSFKQYSFGTPVDLKASVPVDVGAAAAAVASGAVVDPSGSLTNLDTGALDDLVASMSEDLRDEYGSNVDLAQITGQKTIVTEARSGLPAALPYRVVVRGAGLAALPAQLRHRVTLTLYSSDLFAAIEGADVSYTVDLPALAGKRLGVTYAPATSADAAALAGFRSTPDGSFPIYTVHVVPVVKLDDVEVARGSAATMGTEHTWQVRLAEPRDPASHVHDYETVAGDELVFGVNGNGVPESAIHERFQQRPSDTAAENLHTVALYYWAQSDAMDAAAAVTQDILVQRLPSVGLFSAPLTVEYFFGLPRSGFYSFRQMDVSHSIVAAAGKDAGATADYHRVSGQFGSLLEGRTFDTLLGRAAGSGVSAVQLLKEANQQQIPIHLVTAANHDAVAPRLALAGNVKANIANAVRNGKQVLVPERAPNHGGWAGVGYIVEDPTTGAAAYLIDGGLNGGADSGCCMPRKREPVRVPIFEILFVLLLILLIILLIIYWPVIVAALEPILAGAGLALARLAAVLGTVAAPSVAAAAGPFPGDGIKKPGDCTPAQYQILYDAQRIPCNAPRSCKGLPPAPTSCPQIARNIATREACITARSALMVTCFRGGDAAHIAELKNEQDGLACCIELAACIPCI